MPRVEPISDLTENKIAAVIVDAALVVHKRLGPGLLESVCEIVLAYELQKLGLECERQVPVPIVYEGITFEEGFRIDLLVSGKVVVELKSVEELAKVHGKIVLTYLRLTNRRLGLLLNFGAPILKDGIGRIVNGLPEASSP